MFKSRPSTSCQAETSPSLRKKSLLLAVQIYLQHLKLSPDAKFDMEDLNPIMYPQEVARLLDILIDFVCFNKELIHACIEIVKVLPKYFHGIPKLLKITYKLCSKKIALCIPEKEANIKWDHVQNFGLIMAELYNMHLITSIPIFMWLDKVLKFILIDDAEESCLMVFKRCAIKLEKENRKAFKKYEAACISLQLENRQTHLTEASDKCIETNAKENIETAWTYLMEMEIEFSPPNRDYENPMKLKDYAKSLIKETYSHPDQAESCADIFINRYNKNSSDTSALRDAIASLCDSEIQKIVNDANGARNVDQAFGTFNFTAEMFKQRYLNTGIALKILRALYKLASSDCNQSLCLLLEYLKLTNKAYVTRTGAFPIEIFVFLEKQEENQRISRLSRDCIRNLLSNIKMQFCEKLEFLDKWPEIMSPNVNVVLCNSTVFSDIIAQLTTSNEEEILDKLLSLHFPMDCRPFVTVFASKAIESPEMSSLILNLCQKIPTEYHKYLDPETFTRDLKSFLLAEIKKELKNYQQNENEATFDRITRIIICMSEFASRDPSYVNPLIEQANIVLGFERSKKHATLFILLELVAAIKTFNGQIYSTQA